MNHESPSSTQMCPYSDCRAFTTYGKKFCKACGRPIQNSRASAPTPAVSGEPSASPPEISEPGETQSVIEQAAPQDLQGSLIPPNASLTSHFSMAESDATPQLSDPSAEQPDGPAANQRLFFVAAVAALILAGGIGYWLMKPNAVHLAVLPAQVRTNASALTSSPAPIAPPHTLRAETESEGANGFQEDDALRHERERITAERVKLEKVQEEAREQDHRRQQEFAEQQQESEAQQRAVAELKTKQEEHQRQVDEERHRLAEEQARGEREAQVRRIPPLPAPPQINGPFPTYTGPSSGEIVWVGAVKGTELITIENGQSSSGTVMGVLPGTAVLIQPTDTKKVSIASTPGPRNQYSRLVFRVSGNGNTRVIFKWSLP
jgi:hypothetical protein